MNIYSILDFIQFLFLLSFAFSSIYLLFFAIASFFYKSSDDINETFLRKFVILIPAYKEDAVILNTASEALNQDYPSELYDIYIIADSFEVATIELLKENEGVNFIEVSFEHSTKARSINKALEAISDDYDGIIILDADNVMESDILQKVNSELSKGNTAIQCHRVAKNLDTSFAILDAVSEEINNTIFRKGHVPLGLSSALIGSGMAFDFKLYKTIMQRIDTFADEDKYLEIKLALNQNKVKYLNNAYVYDEKVSNSKVFVNQRSRWLSSQIFYARTFIFNSIYELFAHSNFDYFNKIIQFLLVPRILLLGLSFIFAVFSLFFNFGFFFYSWLGIFLACVLAIALSVPKRFYNKRTYIAILSLPYGFLMMGLALFKIKRGHKRLKPTPHNNVTRIDINKIRK
jgi:cellulose synthase/poly-beta-1,6-N-acetylglucosamine synthase-like glycosyltransferase